MNAPTVYRFLRVLEYVGTVERLNEARERRGVKGTQHFGGNLTIYEGILGDGFAPMHNQVRKKLCEMLVRAADELPLEPHVYTEDYRTGYQAACQELLALIEFRPTNEQAT